MSRAQPTVLYVDGSVGFGGSSKSLGLTLSGLDGIEKLLLTTQEPEIVRELFGPIRRWPFRTRINYRTRARLLDRLEPYGYLVKRIVMKGYGLVDTMASMLGLLKILWIVKRHDVDIIHLNNGYLPREAIRAARLCQVSVIAHLRGYIESPVVPWVVRTAPKVDRTITVSDAAIANLREALPELEVVTIYDPVNLPAIRSAAGRRERIRTDLGVADDDVLIGIFGRIVRWKGHIEFVRACARAMESAPGIFAMIVGDVSDGSEEYLRELEELIAGSGVADRFTVTGYRSDVEAFYHAVDIAVHASIAPEPFGMVIPEAMAASRPVIVSDAGGPREIVTDGVDGLRVPPGDVPALSKAIVTLARSPERRRAMGERGKRTVAERFTMERSAAAVRRVYQQLLER